MQARVRTVSIHAACNGAACAGDVTSSQVCNTEACEGELVNIIIYHHRHANSLTPRSFFQLVMQLLRYKNTLQGCGRKSMDNGFGNQRQAEQPNNCSQVF